MLQKTLYFARKSLGFLWSVRLSAADIRRVFRYLITFSPSYLLTGLLLLSAISTSHLLNLSPSAVLALDVPALQGYVNDYANMISPAVRQKIVEELKAFEQSDSTQLVILTVPSLEGDTIEDFAIKVAETWKIGQKGKDNGILFVVASNERKIRIEVGRGLEGRLTDLMAGRIIDLVIKPRFKRGDFDGGFVSGVHALIDSTRGEFKASETQRRPRMRAGMPLLAIIIFCGIALSIVGSISRVAGAAAGAIGLPVIAYLSMASLSFVALLILGGVGLVAGIVLPFLRHGGGGGLGGGGWGSGFGGLGGGDGGGFSGGGGDFGGGGASGDW